MEVGAKSAGGLLVSTQKAAGQSLGQGITEQRASQPAAEAVQLGSSSGSRSSDAVLLPAWKKMRSSVCIPRGSTRDVMQRRSAGCAAVGDVTGVIGCVTGALSDYGER